MGSCTSRVIGSRKAPVLVTVDTKELESQRRGFLKAIENIEPFNEMSDRLVDELFAKSVVLDFAPYATVYNQRDKATAIFILVKGAVTSADGVTSLANGVFGHVEVIEGFHRVKTMIAGRPGATLRKINADDLNAAIEKQTSVTATKAFRVLRETPVFSGMSERELLHLKDQLYSKTFEPGAVIIRKGDMNADEMYIIESGSAVVSDYSEETDLLQTVTGGLVTTRAADKEIILKSRGYFGEEALLTAAEDLEDEPPPTRRATVRGGPKGCRCLVLAREVFERVLAPVRHRFYRNIVARDTDHAKQAVKANKAPRDVQKDLWENRQGFKGSNKPPPPPSAASFASSSTPASASAGSKSDEAMSLTAMRRRASHSSKRLRNGDLRQALAVVDPETGELVPADQTPQNWSVSGIFCGTGL